MSLGIIVLTLNEALHIQRCLQNVLPLADEVLVVDSYSTDQTVTIARRLGARVLQHEWTNHATQMNWALDNGEVATDWIMRLDADEMMDQRLGVSIRRALDSAPNSVSAFEVARRIRFMGREVRHGGIAPMWVTRIWRNGQAVCENRWMDEHMVVTNGLVARLEGSIVDDNLNTLTWWTAKHNGYSSREALDALNAKYGLGIVTGLGSGMNSQARKKRWIKTRIYARMPLGLRAWLYFVYRVVFRLGFLDGKTGVIFHALQALWYRLLVDAKVQEVEDTIKRSGCTLQEAVRNVLSIDLSRIE